MRLETVFEELLNGELGKIDWDLIALGGQEYWNIFGNKLNNVINRTVPSTKIVNNVALFIIIVKIELCRMHEKLLSKQIPHIPRDSKLLRDVVCIVKDQNIPIFAKFIYEYFCIFVFKCLNGS